jgi:hypothetical protein
VLGVRVGHHPLTHHAGELADRGRVALPSGEEADLARQDELGGAGGRQVRESAVEHRVGRDPHRLAVEELERMIVP